MYASAFRTDEKSRVTICGAPQGHDARVVADIALRCKGTPAIFVAVDDIGAAVFSEALSFFAPHIEVISFPAWDCLPYDRVSPQSEIMGRRLSALARLGKAFANPCVLVTTVNAIGQMTVPREFLRDACLNFSVGDELPHEKLRAFLAGSGYMPVGTVRDAGEYAVRGGIVDLFPSGRDLPLRIDFFGDEIESIRTFDPIAQTTLEKVDNVEMLPSSEVSLDQRSAAHFRSAYRELFGAVTDNDPLYEAVTEGRKFPGVEHWLGLFYPRLESLFDYLPRSPVIFDWQAEEAAGARRRQVEDFYQSRLSLYQAAKRSKGNGSGAAIYKPAPMESLYSKSSEMENKLSERAVASLSPFPPAANELDAGAARGRDFADARAGGESGLYSALKKYSDEQQARGKRIAVACYSEGSAERLAGLLKAHGILSVKRMASWEEARKSDIKTVSMLVLGLERGFVANDATLITEQDILGDRLVRQSKKRASASKFQIELGSLNIGDFVVHAEHGIGRYEGLEAINALGSIHDCLKLVYDGGDKLFLPVENLDALTRYGSAESGAVLDKLGGAAWQARKSRVKKRLKDMADALMKIAAERQLKDGEIVQAPEGAYQEFSAHFPYPETDDQSRAISEVLEDLSKGKPMDRLVCGDVGFGKTEVALRAAFAAVQSGLQVAVVVPTTLLARQHFNSFSQRFSGFSIRVAQLSRMVTAAEAKKTKELLKDGKIDIVIGTHALLAADVKFPRLGLLVIDEEQHFGVKQKERMKEMKADVHVLTLTATPIPRTLQLAMAGVRELSLISTPPVDRLAVRSFVLPFDPMVIREALMREHYRGGQSFYVCPRIEDLAEVAAALRELVPEIKLVSAHGRMSPTELDDIMTAFDAKKFDVLLATNIVESGLDIPNANTIILHRADMFGLAQLYQLRGRVGRAKNRGYAYFTYPADAILSQTAQRRLEVIQTLDHLGAGFQLASHDMDIRGAGNLLGEEQSGHIREVGIELYQQMLEDAVAVARAGEGTTTREERRSPQINMGISVLIPETYVCDLNVRLGLYRRLADMRDAEEIESIAAEMIDRFGELPKETENLLQTVAIKTICRKANIARLEAGQNGAVISFFDDVFPRPDRLVAWIGKQAGTAKVRPDQKLVLVRAWGDAEKRIEGVKSATNELANMAARL